MDLIGSIHSIVDQFDYPSRTERSTKVVKVTEDLPGPLGPVQSQGPPNRRLFRVAPVGSGSVGLETGPVRSRTQVLEP